MLKFLSLPFSSSPAQLAVSNSEFRQLASTAEQNLYNIAFQPISDLYTLSFFDTETTKFDDTDKLKFLHTVKCTPKPQKPSSPLPTSKIPLVLLHGYGNGIGYFSRMVAPLSDRFPSGVFAVDLPGFGLSSRFQGFPPTSPPSSSPSTVSNVKAAEDYFVDELEVWREKNKIPKMVLCGHSLGGYLSVAYCEKYPDRVDKVSSGSDHTISFLVNLERNSALLRSSCSFLLLACPSWTLRRRRKR